MTVLAGIMGWPVAHSRSPRLHGYWLARHGIDGAYLRLPVPPDRLAAALRGLPALGFAGGNLTVPHKEAALALVDHVDPLAARIGAINTVVVRSDGSLEGRNTDAPGFLASLAEAAPAWQPTLPAAVIGAGGAARAVVAALIQAGCPEIRLANRSPARTEALAAAFGPAVTPLPWDQRHSALDGVGLLVNTTTQGMHGQPALALDLADLPRSALVTDIVYTPLVTPLLEDARHRGNPVVDGLGMLLHQARAGFAAWFGVMPEVTTALREHVLGG